MPHDPPARRDLKIEPLRRTTNRWTKNRGGTMAVARAYSCL